MMRMVKRVMGPVRQTVLAAVVMWALGAGTSTGAAGIEDSLIFYSSFDKGFEADKASGSAKPVKVVGEPKLAAGKFGQALEVTSRKNGLVFNSDKNLPTARAPGVSSRGTISFWIMPVDWDAISATTLHFGAFETEPQVDRGLLSVSVPSPRGSSYGMFFFVWPNFNPANPEALPAGGWPTCFSTYAKLRGSSENDATMQLRPGTWYHLAFTWRGGEIAAYVNGQPGGRMGNGEVNLDKLGGRFFIGAGDWEPILFCEPGCWKMPAAIEGRNTPWKYLVDDFAVFNDCLSPTQVKKLQENAGGAPAYARSIEYSGAAEFEFYSYPSSGKLQAQISCEMDPAVLAKAAARVEVRRPGDETSPALLSEPVPWDGDTGKFDGFVDTSRLPREVMEIRAVVKDGSGKEIGVTKYQRYNLTRPVWLGNQYGKGDYVPTPWPKLTATDEETQVYGRRYAYNADLTMRSMVSKERELLAAPMRLWLKEGDKSFEFRTDAKSRDTRASGTMDTRVNRGKMGEFPAVVTAKTEFDGFITWELELSPSGNRKLDELILEIPLNRDYVTYMTSPARRDAQVPVKPISGAFLSDDSFGSGGYTWHVQCNDHEVGFQWTMDSSEHWSNADEHKQINVIPRDKELVLQLRMIDKPTALNKPVKYRFFFEALPVKPLTIPHGEAPWPFLDPENKIAWDFNVPLNRQEGFTYEGFTPGTRLTGGSSAGGSFGNFCFSTDPTPEEIAKVTWKDTDQPKPVRAPGQYHGNYHFVGTVWSCDSFKPGFPLTQEGEVYGSEWAMGTGSKAKQESWGYVFACPNEAFDDHFAFWVRNRMMSGNSTIYYDHGGSGRTCVNTGHGHGSKDEKGVVHPYVPILELRHHQMRAYKAMKEIRPFNAMQTHCSAEKVMGVAAFTDSLYDTETISVWSDRVKARGDAGGYWSASLPWDWMMTQFYSPVLGVAMSFGPMMRGEDLRPEMLSSPNVPFYNDPPRNHVPLNFKIKRHISRDQGALARHMGNICANSPTYPIERARRFVCADEQKGFSGQGDLKIAYWPVKEAGNRLLVTAANFAFEDIEKEITVDVGQIRREAGEANFDCPADAQIAVVWDTETGDIVPVTGKNRLKLKLGKKDYRDFEITFVRPKEKPAVVPAAMSESNAKDSGMILGLWKDLKPEFQRLADKKSSYLYDYPLIPRSVKIQREALREARAKGFIEGAPAAAFGLDAMFYAWPRKSAAPYYRWAVTETKKVGKHDEQKAFSGLDGLKLTYWANDSALLIATVANPGTEDLEREISVDMAQLSLEMGKLNPFGGREWIFSFAYDIENGDAFPATGENKFKVKVGKKDYRNLHLSFGWKPKPEEPRK
jgi:hypothetical protein